VLEVARRLARRGHEVTISARGAGPRARERLLEGGVRLVERPDLGPAALRQLGDYASLRRWLARGADGADLLHVHLPLLPPLPLAHAAAGRPLVATFHSPMLTDAAAITEPGLRARLLKLKASLVSRRIEGWYLGHADRIVAVSRGVREELAQAYSFPQARVAVVPNGVDLAAFAYAAPAEPGPEPSVLYVGRLGYRKGLFRLLDAFAMLPGSPRLVLAGEGPLRAALARRAEALGVTRRVAFAGFLERERLRAAFGAAACVVNPADYESGPLVLLEAMAAGAPVVSTPTGLARELGPGPPILLVRPDPGDLAAKIAARLAEPPEVTAARARRARALVEREYGWDRVVDRLEEAYGAARERLAA
jgi:glycosyltransferase involved in cell wall biosynthesis